MTITILLLLGVWFLSKKSTAGLNSIDLFVGWGIKLLFGLAFIYIYTEYYGNGTLSSDINVFMWESGILSDVFYQSPGDYFKFLFGLENQQMIDLYLSKTDHWSSGDLALINDAQNVVRINSLIYFISKGNVYVHLLVFSFLFLLGLRELYLTFHDRVLISPRWFWYGLLIFPSFAFWSGSILKEPLMLVGLFLLVRALVSKLSFKARLWRMALGLLLMLMFKPYVLFIFIIAIVPYLILKAIFRLNALQSIVATIVMIVVSSVVFVDKRDAFVHFIWRKQFDFDNVSRGGLHALSEKDSCFYYFETNQYKNIRFFGDTIVVLPQPMHAKKMKLGTMYPFEDVYIKDTGEAWVNYYSTNKCRSYIRPTLIAGSGIQLLKNIPEALLNAAIRPFPNDPGGKLKSFNFLETLLLFSGLIYSLIVFRNRRNQMDWDMIWLLLWFSFLLFLLIGWTTPVLGAIARYRIPAYLALFIGAVLAVKKQKT